MRSLHDAQLETGMTGGAAATLHHIRQRILAREGGGPHHKSQLPGSDSKQRTPRFGVKDPQTVGDESKI